MALADGAAEDWVGAAAGAWVAWVAVVYVGVVVVGAPGVGSNRTHPADPIHSSGQTCAPSRITTSISMPP